MNAFCSRGKKKEEKKRKKEITRNENVKKRKKCEDNFFIHEDSKTNFHTIRKMRISGSEKCQRRKKRFFIETTLILVLIACGVNNINYLRRGQC